MATLIGLTGDWDLAEECAQDAFTRALEVWTRDGIPARARRLADDDRPQPGDRPSAPGARRGDQGARAGDGRRVEPTSPDGEHAGDERLRLIFTCCHPALTLEARVALTLRTLAGLTTAEIARAFLVPEPTMAKRLVRAKTKIRHAGIPYRVPPLHAWPERLSGVLAVVYLLFNEGYHASAGADVMRRQLAVEAIRLGRALVTLMPDEPEAAGLLALMLLHDARRDARVDDAGDLVPLEEQDRSRWDHAAIAEGVGAARRRRAAASRPAPYQVQAAIARCHVTAADAPRTPTGRGSSLHYDELYAWMPTPVVALNRADRRRDGRRSRRRARARRRARSRRARSPATRCCRRRAPTCCAAPVATAEAATEYRDAVAQARTDDERRYLQRRLAEVQPRRVTRTAGRRLARRERAPRVVPRDAATVMLVRDAPDLEVFMLRRNLDSVWIAGASVFPGGAVDADDRHPRWEARCAGWDDVRGHRARSTGPSGGLGFFVAAVRETFEEAGVLLARDPDGVAADGRHDHLTAARAALNAGEHDFDALVQRARPRARHRRAAPGVALGHAAGRPAPLRHLVLPRRRARGRVPPRRHRADRVGVGPAGRRARRRRPRRGRPDLPDPQEPRAPGALRHRGRGARRGPGRRDARRDGRAAARRRPTAGSASRCRATPRSTTGACRAQPDAAEHDARGAERAVAAGAARRRRQPVAHDRAGDEHVPRGRRRGRGHRPGPGLQAAHRRDRRRRRARPHPLDRAHPHASRPRARRDAAGEGDRRARSGPTRSASRRCTSTAPSPTATRSTAPSSASRCCTRPATRRTTSASSSTRSGCCSPATRSSAGCSRSSRRRPAATWPTYMATLDRLRKIRRLRAIAPGHGEVIDEPKAQDRRVPEAPARPGAAGARGSCGAARRASQDIVATLYVDTPEPLLPVAAKQVYAHLKKLRGRGQGHRPRPAQPLDRHLT